MAGYRRGAVDEDITFAALASKTSVAQIFGNVVGTRMVATSIEAAYAMQDLTAGDDVGPIMVGLAHSAYSNTEIQEYLEQAGSWNEATPQSQEVNRRMIKRIGIFPMTGQTEDQVLNDGKPIKTKLNWLLTVGQSLDIWVYNMGGAAVATTTPNVHAQGHVNLFPR